MSPIYDEDDDEEPWGQDANGPNGLRVMREQCSTCIFRSGNPMQLRPGRVKDMTDQTDRADSNVVCHQTLGGEGALCKGSVDRQPGQMMRIAYRLNAIEWIEPHAVGQA